MPSASRVIILTGASSGIGRAAAAACAARGWSIAVVGRNAAALDAVRRELAEAGAHAVSVTADVTAEGAADRIVDAALREFGGVDGLVNAAGSIRFGALEATSDDDWGAMEAVNVTAPFRLMRAAAPALRSRRGSIVNVSSVTGLRAFPGLLAYCVAKAAVDQLTRCAALELAPEVRVNAVNPGVVRTELHRRGGLEEPGYQALLARSRETHPLGRVGEPAEVAELIAFLLSEQASWITGETIAIDGGRHLTCAR
jgi:NAD(P)-dependent dehydrogenase (short-subunit alcohol dehydrogenase family)